MLRLPLAEPPPGPYAVALPLPDTPDNAPAPAPLPLPAPRPVGATDTLDRRPVTGRALELTELKAAEPPAIDTGPAAPLTPGVPGAGAADDEPAAVAGAAPAVAAAAAAKSVCTGEGMGSAALPTSEMPPRSASNSASFHCTASSSVSAFSL